MLWIINEKERIKFTQLQGQKSTNNSRILTPSIFLCQVREAPDVAEADGVADGSKEVSELGVPGLDLVATFFVGLDEARYGTNATYFSLFDICYWREMHFFNTWKARDVGLMSRKY